ncbi:MAG: ABC transporter substrate-binding protein, partial [Burkholderiaceae bacterium]
MMMKRHPRIATALALTAAVGLLAFSGAAAAQAKKTSIVLGMTLEPAPGLDPTVAPAAAIG